jgi:hypothetical protein
MHGFAIDIGCETNIIKIFKTSGVMLTGHLAVLVVF